MGRAWHDPNELCLATPNQVKVSAKKRVVRTLALSIMGANRRGGIMRFSEGALLWEQTAASRQAGSESGAARSQRNGYLL